VSQSTVGPYDVVQLLAAGGMAEIFLGAKRGPGGFEKRVVLKRIAKKLLGDKEIRGMFLDEARVQALLEHPNVVQIYDFGEDGGSYYMAMEFVHGATLRWVIDNAAAVQRPVPVRHALRIVSDVLAGLHYAHELKDEDGRHIGIIHRDISPVNILVSRAGVAKLCDFGVAKSRLQRMLTRVGIIKGKFRYMSPEQLNAQPLDQRADVFAVGICLWELLVGRRLFHSRVEDDVVRAIRSGEYPDPSDYREGMPRAIDRLLRRALHIDPRRRYKTAREFQLACEEILRLLPKTSNSVLLGEYVSAELDGTAGLKRDPTRTARVDDDSLLGTGMGALDPPVPDRPTSIVSEEELSDEGEVRHDETTEVLPPPSTMGKIAGAALMAPAAAFTGIAKAASAVSRAVSSSSSQEGPNTDSDVRIRRTTSRD
jgi:serine/threonine-protein kinase